MLTKGEVQVGMELGEGDSRSAAWVTIQDTFDDSEAMMWKRREVPDRIERWQQTSAG
jgi:hypothetical protein